MKILALDTTAKTATVALCEGTDDGVQLIAEYTLETTEHSTVLLPMIESALGLTGGKVELYAVSVGPGSFTGVRIGVATVKGLAFADHTPTVGVSSLEAMARACGGLCGLIVPVIDARRELVYTALFRGNEDGSITRLTEDSQIPIAELLDDLLPQYGEGETVWFTGDATEKLMRQKTCPGTAAVTPVRLRKQSGYGVAAAAWHRWTTEDHEIFTDGATVPVYLKKSQAEREREERLAQNNA